MGWRSLLFPGIGGVQVDGVWSDGQTLHIMARATGTGARCPCCGRRSRRRHSRYQRTIADLACCGRRVVIHLQARRFWCGVRSCRRKVFCERLLDVAAAWARGSRRLQEHWRGLALRLGGAAAARQAADDGAPVSRRTLLRLLRGMALPAAGPVRVLGIDDWARRKGRTYGTLLVDLEAHEVIDLLPDRTASTVAMWLKAHPEIEVISRDRGGAYAEAARQGAPQAKQIADRWHLLCNLGDAVERLLGREHANLRRAASAIGPEAAGVTAGRTAPTGVPSPDGGPPASPPAASLDPPAPTALERERAVSRECRLARYEEVLALQKQGLGIATIAKRLGMARKTVRRFLRAGGFPERLPRSGPPGVLAPFFDYLQARWDAGFQNARQLYRELKALGYPGSASHLSEVLATWRTEPAPTGRRRTAPWPASVQRRRPLRSRPADRSPRQARFLLFRQTEQLDAQDHAYRDALFTVSPILQTVHRLVEEFQRLVSAHAVGTLASWLTAAQETGVPELQGFVVGVRQDRAAIEAGITEPWSQGQVEGQVNRLKVIKRSMFGRANFDLLRLRVLHPI